MNFLLTKQKFEPTLPKEFKMSKLVKTSTEELFFFLVI